MINRKTAALFLLCVMLLLAAVGSRQDFTLGTSPGNPNSGKIRLWSNSTSGKLECLNSSGGDCMDTVSPFTTVSYSGTPTFDASLGNAFKITLTGNVTSSTLSNARTGQVVIFSIYQDGTGGRTFVWPTNVLNACTIDSTISAATTQVFLFDGTNATAISPCVSDNAGSTGGAISFPGSTSGSTLLQASATASGTLTLPAATATLTYTVANGAKALATGAISSGACTSAQTDTATGATTSDTVIATFSADPTSTTGYSATANGMLSIIAYPTSNTVNFKVCNNTASSITPGAVTLNWRVAR